MNKKFILLTIATILVCVMLSSCTFLNFEDMTTSPEIITEANITLTPNAGGEEKTTEQKAEETTEALTEATTEENTTASIGEIIGYTSKGFVITKKDGITYVDGVLITNKTYSLPKDYNPGDLLPECQAAFEQMKAAAAAENLNLWNASGFRSYELQESLYTRYSNRDGKAAADRYSARPGHSEHQTGLAIDLNTITSAFADTNEGKWVAENCHKYGFIIRYAKDKEAETGYMYEAWHIRYVGTEVAEKIYNSGLCLEEYFGITSKYSDTVSEPAETEETTTAITENTTAAEETTALTAVG